MNIHRRILMFKYWLNIKSWKYITGQIII